MDMEEPTFAGARTRRSKKSKTNIPKYPKAALTLASARRAVYEGRAQMTKGGLTKSDLKVSKSTGKIVSRRKSKASKKMYSANGLAILKYQKA